MQETTKLESTKGGAVASNYQLGRLGSAMLFRKPTHDVVDIATGKSRNENMIPHQLQPFNFPEMAQLGRRKQVNVPIACFVDYGA